MGADNRKVIMNEKEKKKIAKEFTDMAGFHLAAFEMEVTKENLKYGVQMLVEGINYILDKEKEEQKKFLEGFGCKK